MPYTRAELQGLHRNRIITMFLQSIVAGVVDAANQGKTSYHLAEPHYEKSAWHEFLKEIVESVQTQFPGCEVVLDEHLGITVRWD